MFLSSFGFAVKEIKSNEARDAKAELTRLGLGS
jgi:hypothetical protein